MSTGKTKELPAIILIGVLSLVIIGLVTILYLSGVSKTDVGFDIYLIPKVHAIINSMVSVLLIAGLYFIKQKRISAHKASMFSALVLSALFLISYVFYHSIAEPTSYGGTGFLKYLYYFILITHIILAAVSLPFILLTFYRALVGDFVKHKKIAKRTWPVWFYVSVTGVIVYLMISPYYV